VVPLGKTLWNNGFPKLICATSPKGPFGHVPDDSEHAPAAFVEGAFGLSRAKYPLRFSHLWSRAEADGHLFYSNERDTHSHVMAVVEDVIELLRKLPGFGAIKCQEEASVYGLKRDAWILTRFDLPIGVIEVKMPKIPRTESEADDPFPLDDRNVHGQVLDYLLMLKSLHNVAGFALLTTYKHWRVCWLPEADEAARALPNDALRNDEEEAIATVHHRSVAVEEPRPTRNRARRGPLATVTAVMASAMEMLTLRRVRRDAGEPLTRDGDPPRVLHGTQLYHYQKDGKILFDMIFSAVRKMCRLQVSLKMTDILAPGRPCIVLRARSPHQHRGFLPRNVNSLDFSQLPSKPQVLYLLHQLGAGVDGSVFLACDGQGVHAVLKFAHEPKVAAKDAKAEKAANEESLRREAVRWARLGDVARGSTLLTLSGRVALMIPFFKPAILSTRSLEDKQQAAERAIRRLAEAGMRHDDVRGWRHVGMFQDADGTINGVLLDLARVTEIDPHDRAAVDAAVDAMKKSLGAYTASGAAVLADLVTPRVS
jgi:hypothetical protein